MQVAAAYFPQLSGSFLSLAHVSLNETLGPCSGSGSGFGGGFGVGFEGLRFLPDGCILGTSLEFGHARGSSAVASERRSWHQVCVVVPAWPVDTLPGTPSITPSATYLRATTMLSESWPSPRKCFLAECGGEGENNCASSSLMQELFRLYATAKRRMWHLRSKVASLLEEEPQDH